MNAKVTWRGRLSFRGAAETGFSLPLGTEAVAGEEEGGFRPMELIAIGLAGCTAMDVISILQKKRQQVSAFEVEVHANRAEMHPKVFTEAEIEYHVCGHELDETALLRAIELSATRYCPVQAMLSRAFSIRLKYKLYENGGEAERVLVKSGECALAILPAIR